jgi:acyl carrier protein
MAEPLPLKSAAYETEAAVRAGIQKIVKELAPNPQATTLEHARLTEDMEYHSLALLELAFALEDEFDLPPMDEATARKISTVQDVQNHVVGVLQAAGRIPGSAG